jgi:hypothetical protein
MSRVPLNMGRIHLQCPGSDPLDQSVVANILRQEPDEEEDEEEDDEGDGRKDEDEDGGDDGYSE